MKNQKNTTKTYPIHVGAILIARDNIKKQSGITLIALVITIIILLILAGIVINLTIGENGIITKAQQAGINYEEAGAREKLELALVDLQAQKVIDSTYNETTYIDNYLGKKQMPVNGNIVTVGKWQFEIDRSVPKIASSLGKGDEIITEQKANLTVGNMTDGKFMLKIEVALPNDTIQGIEIYDETNNKIETINVPVGIKQIQKEQEIYVEFMENKSYYAKIIGENSNIQTNTVSVKNENIIATASDLKKLAILVNSGETFEGKTIIQVEDIDLSTVCGSEKGNWEPIGKYISKTDNKPFSGTFEGNNHTIDYLYINTTNDYQGLFGYVENGTIRGIVIRNNSNIIGGIYTGGIIGDSLNSTIQNCGNNAHISGETAVGGIIGGMYNSNLEGCYNKANIIANNNTAGGIVGDIYQSQNGEYYLKNSYNEGNITVGNYGGGIIGDINAENSSLISTTISNCYNTGIIANNIIGGIVARVNGNILVEYCYNLGRINNNVTTGNIGGIVGRNRIKDTTSDIKAVINYCYNSADVISIVSASAVGGLIGINDKNCYVKNSNQLVTAEVKNGSNTPTGRMGTASNNYTGRLIGQCYSDNAPYIDTVYQSNGEDMPTVYDALNEFSENASEYWSNTNVNAPKLLWEK